MGEVGKSIMTHEEYRKAQKYEEYRKAQLEDGQLYQDFVVDLAYQAGLVIVQYASKAYQLNIGESRTGVEIKHDKRRKKTGNLYIEVAEKARPRLGPYVPAGIMREGHWLYAIGDYDKVWFFANGLLRALYVATNGNSLPKYRRPQDSPTSQGWLLPEVDADRYAALILTPNAEGKVANLVTDLAELARRLHSDLSKSQNQLSFFNDK